MIVVALEDICVADIELVGMAVSASSNAKLRAKLGGDWAVAGYLVREMCRAIKDRTADDMMILAGYSSLLSNGREELPALSVGDRIARALECPEPLEARGLAAWFAIGTNKVRGEGLAEVEGCPETFFDALRESGVPGQTIEISRLALRRTREIMAVMLPLAHQRAQGCRAATIRDEMPGERNFGPVPSWVFDIHTRGGLAAFSGYLKASARMQRFVKESFDGSIPPHRMIGWLVFRMEGGLCAPRLNWPEGQRLCKLADRTIVGIAPDAAPEGLSIVREEMDLLNACRAEVLPPYLR